MPRKYGINGRARDGSREGSDNGRGPGCKIESASHYPSPRWNIIRGRFTSSEFQCENKHNDELYTIHLWFHTELRKGSVRAGD